MQKTLEKLKELLITLITVISVGIMVFTIISVNTLNRNDRSLFGYKFFIVLSDSMKDEFSAGDVVVVKQVSPSTLKEGDMDEQLTVGTHRVVEIEPTEKRIYFHTKGDANDTVDAAPVAEENVVGVPVFAIPMLGYLANAIQTPPGSYISVAVCAALIVLAFLPDLLRRRQSADYQAEIRAAVEQALAEERAKNANSSVGAAPQAKNSGSDSLSE